MKTPLYKYRLTAFIILFIHPLICFCQGSMYESDLNVYEESRIDVFDDSEIDISEECMVDTGMMSSDYIRTPKLKPIPRNIYEMPYSMTGKFYDWKRLWINTATLCGAFIGSLIVLECLPEDATSWNRAELQKVPLFKRWREHVIVEGPEWDHDKFYFNYLLHPYAGAAYFMAARSCGFNFWQSLLYCSLISNVGWEYGVEAFMERPSIQDLFITPLVGSVIGECFYKLKRHIVSEGYTLGGSSVLGNIVVFLIDPVNEVIGLFGGNPARKAAKRYKSGELSSSFIMPSGNGEVRLGFSLAYSF